MRKTFAVAGLGAALALAVCGCTSTPAMSQRYVAALRTGRLMVNVAPNAVVANLPPPRGAIATEETMYGAVGVLVGGIMSGMPRYRAAQTVAYLKPYVHDFDQLPLANDFDRLCTGVVKKVPWLGRGAAVEVSRNHGGWGAGQMQHRTQATAVEAVAFVQPLVVFSRDMDRVSIVASVSVYARGRARASFLAGDDITVGTSLEEARPATAGATLAIPAASHTKRTVLLADRAQAWFADGGARFKSALAADLRLFGRRLTNYLTGRRTP